MSYILIGMGFYFSRDAVSLSIDFDNNYTNEVTSADNIDKRYVLSFTRAEHLSEMDRANF